MKKVIKRVVLTVVLTVYVTVALLNYSVVQSYLGAAAGSYFSREWGCELRIGALHAMPWDHLIVNDVLWVAPDGDTLLTVETVRVSFHRFPFRDGGLDVDRVYLKNAYYHFESHNDGQKKTDSTEYRPATTNLQFLIDYYATGQPPGELKPFPVNVKTLTIDGVHYRQDLPETIKYGGNGVEIAHMEFLDIHGRIRDIHVVNDDVHCRIIHLRTVERSGFAVNDISGVVHVSPQEIRAEELEVRTPKSSISLDALLSYNGWEVMANYLNTVYHKALIKEGTSVAMSDVAYWAPVLWGVEAQIEAEGTAEGTINDLGADLQLDWGHSSELLFTGHMWDIMPFDSARVEADIERLLTNYNDLEPLIAALSLNDGIRNIAEEVGYLDLGGRFRLGVHTPSTANLALESGVGRLRADVSMTPLEKGILFDVEAGSDELRLRSKELKLKSGFSISAAGQWSDLNNPKKLHADLHGGLMNTVVHGHKLAPVSFEGNMAGGKGTLQLESTDSLVSVGINTDFDVLDTMKYVSATLDIDQIDLHAFGLTSEQFAVLKSDAKLNFNGKDLDHMEGRLTLTGTQLGATEVDRLTLTVDAGEEGKLVRLKSDPMDLTVTGQFNYDDLGLMVRQMACEVLPKELCTADTLTTEEQQRLKEDTLRFHLHWKDDGRFLHTVAKDITVAKGTLLDGSFTEGGMLKTVLRSDSLRIGTVLLDNVGLSSRGNRANVEGMQRSTDYGVEAEAQSVMLGDMELLQRAKLKLMSNPQRILAGLQWGDDRSLSTGDLMLHYEDEVISVTRPSFYVAGHQWNLTTKDLRVGLEDGLTVPGGNITLSSDEQEIGVGLRLQQQQNDCVELTFRDFSLGGVTDLLLQEIPFSVAGDIRGHLSLYGLNETPYFNANLTINDCSVNRQSLGALRLRSNWNAELNMLNLEVLGEMLNATGWLGLAEKDPEMNFAAHFNRFDLGLLAPLLQSFSSRFEGLLHGDFDVRGTVSKPTIEGEAIVEQGALKVDLTGVTYYFDDTIGFTDKRVTLNRFILRDPQERTVTVAGEIGYNSLSDIMLDLQVSTDNLLVLDRQRGEEFYGILLASLAGTVKGPVDQLQVGVRARTNAGSRVTVPVSDQRQVKAQNYITFVGAETEGKKQRSTRQNEGQLNLELDLNITPDLQLELPMDFSDVTVNVGASGQGDLHLSLTGTEEPQVMGSYEITSGTMKLGLMSLIEKNFTIESGSNLGFQGGLSDARFDLKAVYSQRVNLSTLTGSLDEVSGGQKNLQVNNIIAVSGTLQEPKISFDLRIPNADASVEDEVFAYIDRKNERDMLTQTLSLLVMGQFYNANKSSVNGNLAASGGIGALSGILSDMVGIVDINVDYKAANEVTKQQVDVNISKDWGRWYLESTLGYGGESQELETRANGAILDALVGYRLTPLMHLYAYNRTNTNDYTRLDLPYKQGIGLKLTKDFDRWGDLFKKKKK